MTTIFKGAVYRPVVNGGGQMRSHLGLIEHVQQGMGSLFGWFNNPETQVSSTFWVSKVGLLEQYRDAELVAWAQAAGNLDYNSIETEGFDYEPLTEAQIDVMAAVMREGNERYGWPYSPADTSGERGLGWHGMGGAAWGGHTGCPGQLRLAARPTILQKAAGLVIPGGDHQPPLQPPVPPLSEEEMMGASALTTPDGKVIVYAVGAGSRAGHLLEFHRDGTETSGNGVYDITEQIHNTDPSAPPVTVSP